MTISHAERRQIENEMIFRRKNEKVGDELEALDAMLIDDGNADLALNEDLLLHFLCECSDENCTTRIPMRLSKYKSLHANRKNFVVIPGHQVEPIEDVVKATASYNVVHKHVTVPEPAGALNKTEVDNS